MNAVRVLNAYMAIDNDRRLPVIASVVVTVVDVVLDFAVAFVFHGDTLEMGLATSVSNYAALLVLLTHFRRRERLTRFSFRHMRKRSGRKATGGAPRYSRSRQIV